MKSIRGIAAARGYAIGPVVHFHAADLRIERQSASDPQHEAKRLDEALSRAERDVAGVIENARRDSATESAAIFEAQLLMLQDPELLSSIRKSIQSDGVTAEFAIQQATEHYAQALESMPEPYFRARAVDVRDVARRVLRILLNVVSSDLTVLEAPAIVLAQDLAPSDTVTMDKRNVLGLCTVEGSETSHTAILARGLGIPAVVGAGAELLTIPIGAEIILDGIAGEVLVEPAQAQRKEYERKRLDFAAHLDDALARCHEPAITLDGRRVEVVANIGSLEGARQARLRGAEGVGLLRTEFLYMDRTSLPSEEEQYEIYTDLFAEFGELPIVVRTSDIGGDKSIPYLNLTKELNPFLGMRGLRLALAQADRLFKPQLRAVLRAGHGRDLRIMFPMLSTVAELRAARRILEACSQELIRERKPMAERLQVGIMVEVPAAALMADVLATEVDFFSIGTNDLTQYTLAADRTNPNVAGLASAFSPAVLRLINNVISEGHKHGKWVGVCGELAGELLAIPILLGMGLDEFSMNPQTIPDAKQLMRGLNAQRVRGACSASAGDGLARRSAGVHQRAPAPTGGPVSSVAGPR